MNIDASVQKTGNLLKQITVGICSIGSGVGQSVVDSCRLSSLCTRTIGLGNNPLAYGLYECEDHAYLPSYYDPDYIDGLLSVCSSKAIDILVPGHDDEALVLSDNIEKFAALGVEVIVSGADLIRVCRAKETMAESFPTIADLFVKSFTLDEAREFAVRGELELPLLAKPRDGYASKGIVIVNSECDLDKIDDTLILQELAIPHVGDPYYSNYVKSLLKGSNFQVAEISVQLLADKEGQIRAQCATYNKLNNGIPIEILPYENSIVNSAIERLVPLLQLKGLKGPINIQGRLTDRGFKIFEINPRFTGITGLRAVMGFNEVDACLRHWGFNESMKNITLNPIVFGIRQTTNKAIHLSRNGQVERLYQDVHGDIVERKSMPVILVTGSTGTIGRNLVNALLQQGSYEVWTLNRSAETARQVHPGVAHLFDWSDFESGRINLGAIDKIVHLASARPFHKPKDIADSLTKGMKLFSDYAAHGSGEIIYASSQSVYGNHPSIPWTEDLSPQPTTIYGQLKFALEQHLEGLRKVHPGISTVSLRIGTVTGNDPVIFEHEALARIIDKAIKDRVIEVYGGSQILGRIHYQDVVAGFMKVINQHSYKNHEVFNLGMDTNHTLEDIAIRVVRGVEKHQPGIPISVIKKEIAENIPQSYAVDPSKFMKKYDWKPDYTLDDIINSLIR